ncbi:MAG: hypothetical protein PHX60_06785 [Giesbergeria sp.]|uniref:hypothetical protein n=1 Tax=Giesbergeria sp. TaxID=2818473 RepID=UPI00262DF9CF|nr:hypothetical protein [Giesbergeria sp.]MDD2609390.1 hypothetical protein [Giesbergeria sp.]
MFEKFRQNSVAARLSNEALHEQVGKELLQGTLRTGLWIKALADCGGNIEKAKSFYIKYRVQSIKDDMELASKISRQHNLSETQEIHPKDEEIKPSNIQISDFTDEQLINILCENIFDSSSGNQLEKIIVALQKRDIDFDTIDLIVADRVGAEGVEQLDFYRSCLKAE